MNLKGGVFDTPLPPPDNDAPALPPALSDPLTRLRALRVGNRDRGNFTGIVDKSKDEKRPSTDGPALMERNFANDPMRRHNA